MQRGVGDVLVLDDLASGVTAPSESVELQLRPSARAANERHLGSFLVDGVGDTDGVHYVPVPTGRGYPLGLLAVQNGEAPEPADTSPVNGYEFDGATQFKCVNFVDALRALED